MITLAPILDLLSEIAISKISYYYKLVEVHWFVIFSSSSSSTDCCIVIAFLEDTHIDNLQSPIAKWLYDHISIFDKLE